MKKPKKNHLGESLQDIIKKQEDTEVKLPGDAIADENNESDSVDLLSGDEFHDLEDENNALTIEEDLHEATMHILENKKKTVNEEKPRIKVMREVVFDSFTFAEYDDEYRLVIRKEQGKQAKEILEKSFLEIITEISDINQFI